MRKRDDWIAKFDKGWQQIGFRMTPEEKIKFIRSTTILTIGNIDYKVNVPNDNKFHEFEVKYDSGKVICLVDGKRTKVNEIHKTKNL